MTAIYHDTEDSVHLLSNPLNDEDVLEFMEGGQKTLDNYEDEPDGTHCHNVVSPHWDAAQKNYPHSRLLLTMALCLIFMIAEVVGGILAGSLAVVTDGAHLFTDLIAFFMSFLAINLARKSRTKKFNYGYSRLEVLTTLISILLIWIITVIFIYLASLRLIKQEYNIDANMMLLVSGLGVIINIIMFVVLHGQCQISHSHSHLSVLESHDVVVSEKPSQNINIRAAMIHVIGDLVQSVGVCVSSIIIKFYPKAKFMDPVCTFIFSIIVMWSTTRLLKESAHILMEGFPRNLEYKNVLSCLQKLDGVRHVHSLCVWSLTLDKNALTAHIAVDDTVNRDYLLLQAQKVVAHKFGINFCTIQIEKHNKHFIDACALCQPLKK